MESRRKPRHDPGSLWQVARVVAPVAAFLVGIVGGLAFASSPGSRLALALGAGVLTYAVFMRAPKSDGRGSPAWMAVFTFAFAMAGSVLSPTPGGPDLAPSNHYPAVASWVQPRLFEVGQSNPRMEEAPLPAGLVVPAGTLPWPGARIHSAHYTPESQGSGFMDFLLDAHGFAHYYGDWSHEAAAAFRDFASTLSNADDAQLDSWTRRLAEDPGAPVSILPLRELDEWTRDLVDNGTFQKGMGLGTGWVSMGPWSIQVQVPVLRFNGSFTLEVDSWDRVKFHGVGPQVTTSLIPYCQWVVEQVASLGLPPPTLGDMSAEGLSCIQPSDLQV